MKPTRLDLYIEKLISKMNLEAEEADEVAREVRSHLEEAIDKAVAAGARSEDAEAEALLRFGQPSVLARQFGVVSGKGWFYFERISAAVLIFYAARLVISSDIGIYSWYLAAAMALLYFAYTTWERIEVNGTLRIYRFLRPTLSIPFENIRRVRFQKGHAIGARYLVIEHDAGEVEVSTRLRNMRCAAVALEVLTPTGIPAEVAAYLAKIRVRRETLTWRIALTMCWLSLAVAFVIGAVPIWRLEGVSWWLAGFLIGLPIVIAVQQFRCDPARRGMLGLLALWWLLGGMMLGATLFMFSIYHARWYLIAFAASILVGLTTLWWTSPRRLPLLMVYGTIAAVLGLVRVVVPWDFSYPHQKVIAEGNFFPASATFASGHDGTFTYLISTFGGKESGGTRVLAVGSQETTQTAFGHGEYWLFPRDGKLRERPFVVRGASDDQGYISLAEVYRIGTAGVPEKLKTIPSKFDWRGYLSPEFAFVSPTERYFVTPIVDEQLDPKRSILAITDLESGTTVPFPKFRDRGSRWGTRWINDEVLEVAHDTRDPNLGLLQRKKLPANYELWHLNARTGEQTKHRDLQFDNGSWDIYRSLGEGDVILVRGADDMSVANIDSGKLVPLPSRPEHTNILDFEKASKLLAYVSRNPATGNDAIIVAGAGGVVAELPLPSNLDIESLSIAPDGKKCFFISRPEEYLFNLAKVTLWDFKTGATSDLSHMNFIHSSTAMINSPYGGFSAWYPDSQSFVYGLGIFWFLYQPKTGSELVRVTL